MNRISTRHPLTTSEEGGSAVTTLTCSVCLGLRVVCGIACRFCSVPDPTAGVFTTRAETPSGKPQCSSDGPGLPFDLPHMRAGDELVIGGLFTGLTPAPFCHGMRWLLCVTLVGERE